jgi:hypothetical protein
LKTFTRFTRCRNTEEQALERAQDTVIRIQGSLILSRALQSPKPFLQLMDKLPKQLLSNI